MRSYEDESLPIEHRIAEARELVHRSMLLDDCPGWTELVIAVLGDAVTERRDALESATPHPIESADFHRGYIAGLRMIAAASHVERARAEVFINNAEGSPA